MEIKSIQSYCNLLFRLTPEYEAALHNYMPYYLWQKKRARPDDHAVDAWRYFIFSLTKPRRKMDSAVAK